MVWCTYCGQEFARAEHLDRHVMTHTNIKPYKCSTCHFSFKRRDLLQRHHILVHGDIEEQASDLDCSNLQRRPIACVACARAKTKCDKAIPSCSRCTSKGLPCEARSTRRSNDAAYRLAKRQLSLYRRPIPIVPADERPSITSAFNPATATSCSVDARLWGFSNQPLCEEPTTTTEMYQSWPVTPKSSPPNALQTVSTPALTDDFDFGSIFPSPGVAHNTPSLSTSSNEHYTYSVFSYPPGQISAPVLPFGAEHIYAGPYNERQASAFEPFGVEVYGYTGFPSPAVQMTAPHGSYADFASSPNFRSCPKPPPNRSSSADSLGSDQLH